MVFGLGHKTTVDAQSALSGRQQEMPVAESHPVLGTPLKPPFPEGLERAVLGMGCFWGAERVFWQAEGVYTTAVGYAGGFTPNPTYEEVCSGRTGHAEVVLVVFHPAKLSYPDILRLFWENHDPTQGMRQGNDIGTQYRSVICWTTGEQREAAASSLQAYAQRLRAAGYPEITTELAKAGPFYYAEDYHQQYLHKNPWGYCGLGGTGVSCPVGLASPDRKRSEMTVDHTHDAPHTHEHSHGGESHAHAHTGHDHEHVEHEHEHTHDGVTHTHRHVHQVGLEDIHEHTH